MDPREDNVAVPEPELPASLAPEVSEIDEIEQQILADIAAVAEEKLATDPPPRRNKKGAGRPPRKQKLIDDIERFRGACPDLLPTPGKLKKTRISDLEIILARCVSEASGVPLKESTPNLSTESEATPTVASPGVTKLNDQTIVRALARINIQAFELAEFASKVAAPHTGFAIEGGANELRSNSDELEQVIAAVYADHKEQLDQYVSPTIAYWSLMANVAVRNAKGYDQKTGSYLSLAELSSRAASGASNEPSEGSDAPSTR